MELGAFVSLEDVSDALASYEEEVLRVEMDPVLARRTSKSNGTSRKLSKNTVAMSP
jgi:hypothetical protein